MMHVQQMPELDDAVLVDVGAFLAARMEVEAWGLSVWMELHGTPDPAFLEALLVWDSEVASADYERRVQDAERSRSAGGGKRR